MKYVYPSYKVVQWHAELAKAYMHGHDMCRSSKWYFSKDMQHMPRPACFSHGMCTSTDWYRRHPTEGIIIRGLYPSSMQHCQKLRDISCGLCTSLSRCWVWNGCIGHGLCASLSGYQAWTSHISLVPHTMARWCRIWDACTTCSLHIYQSTSYVEYPTYIMLT